MSQQVKVYRELQFESGEAFHSGNITGRPSYRNLKVYYEDFCGLQIDTANDWSLACDGTSTVTLTDPDCMTITSNGTDNGIATVAQGLNYYGTYGCAMEVRARNDDVSDLRHFIGFSDTSGKEMAFLYSGTTLTSNATDAVGFLLDYNATLDRYYGVSVNDGTDGTLINSGNVGTADSAWKTYRIEIVPNGTAADAFFYLNTAGSEIDPEADIIGVEPAAVAPAIALCINMSVKGSATADTLDIDYVKIWGGRY